MVFFWIALITVSAILRGVTIMVLWNWFLFPVTGVRIDSVAIALGIGVLTALLTKRPALDPGADIFDRLSNDLLESFGYTTLILIIGFIVHLFT